MTTGKYLACILGLAGCAAILIAHVQPAPRLKLPAGIAAQLKNSNLEALSSPAVATTSPLPLRARFARTAVGGKATPVSLPITLEENVGQAEKRVAYLGRGKGMTALLTRTGIEVLVGPRGGEKGIGGAVKLRVVEVPTGPRTSNRAMGKFVWRGQQKLRGAGTRTRRILNARRREKLFPAWEWSYTGMKKGLSTICVWHRGRMLIECDSTFRAQKEFGWILKATS